MKEKRILITGASGGFGRQFALELEKRGYALWLHGRSRERLQETMRALKLKERHRLICADLANEDEINALIRTVSHTPTLYGLINNAGFAVWGEFSSQPMEKQMQVLAVDLLAPVRLAHALLPKILREHGFIINVSSLAGETPLPYLASYAAAKAGLTFWSEALRFELAKTGVRVVTLAPGPSPTRFRKVSGMPWGKGGRFRLPAKGIVDAALRCLDSGGGFCVPGFKHLALNCVQKLLPRSAAVAIMGRYLRP